MGTSSSSMLSLLSIIFLLSLSWAASDSVHGAFLQCLSTHSQSSHPISAVLYTPDNSSYSSVLESYIRNLRFNTSTTPKPRLIITATHESHIKAALICSKKHGLQMKIRSGGHDYEGVSYVSDVPFFILDMFNLRSISVDIEDESAWVQAGATLGEIYYRIAEKSKIHGFSAGVCPRVGAGGHFSGGVRATFRSLFLGSSERLLSIMNTSLPELGLQSSDCTEMSWVESVLFWTNFATGTPVEALLDRKPQVLTHLKRKSDYLKEPIPKAGLEGIWKKMIELQTPALAFNPYGGKMAEISPSATPFPHRAGNLCKIQYATNWDEEGSEAAERYINLTRQLYRRVYGIKYFKKNFNRLVRIKTKVDPGNFFRNEQSIPTLPY
ncbi:unnamed protein product, partial [Vitis vinifera]